MMAVEKPRPTKPKERDDLAAKLCDGRPGIDPEAVRDELLRIAAELAMQARAGGY